MWAAILALFPTLAGWINDIIGWFQAEEAAQTAANTAESTAETAHQDDGGQSVADQNSDNQQNAALTQEANAIDNPIPVTVSTPSAPKPKGGQS